MTSDSLSTLDALLDRLVDDELTDSERQDLLTRLDTEADGWRRCALRFLEAQVWRRAIRDAYSGWSVENSLVPPASEGAYDVCRRSDAGNSAQELDPPAGPEEIRERSHSPRAAECVLKPACGDAGGEARLVPDMFESEVVPASGAADQPARPTADTAKPGVSLPAGAAKPAVAASADAAKSSVSPSADAATPVLDPSADAAKPTLDPSAHVSQFSVRPMAASNAPGWAGKRLSGRSTWRLLAMAASFGLAFILGMGVRPWLFGPAKYATPEGLQLASDQGSSGTQGIQGESQPRREVPTRPGKPDSGFVQHAAESSLRLWGKMRFVSQQPDGQPAVIELPVYEGASLEEHLERMQQYFPQEYVEQLRQAGFEVRNQPELIPFDLGDGRQLIVPSQRIEVLPTGYRLMQ